MNRAKKTYSLFQLTSAVVMIVALLWLTVSAPFVNAAQQELSKVAKMLNTDDSLCNDEESSNTVNNNTEEKKPSSNNSVSEEYLHSHYYNESLFTIVSQRHVSKNADEYIAYHGELDSPPPDLA